MFALIIFIILAIFVHDRNQRDVKGKKSNFHHNLPLLIAPRRGDCVLVNFQMNISDREYTLDQLNRRIKNGCKEEEKNRFHFIKSFNLTSLLREQSEMENVYSKCTHTQSNVESVWKMVKHPHETFIAENKMEIITQSRMHSTRTHSTLISI